MGKILILANNDGGLYKFRKELIQELLNQENQVYISLPQGDLIHSLIDMGCQYIDTDVDMRGINPLTDFKLLVHYFKIFRQVRPNLVITYTIKPNIYGGIACRIKKIPCAINITGLGTAFQKEGFLKKIIIALYKLTCKKAKVVFFENEENQQIFIDSKIVKRENTCQLKGAGVNLEEYQFCQYPSEGDIHFIFIGRVMKEKGVEELFQAAKRIKKEYKNVAFDVVGPFEDNYQETIKNLEEQGVIKFHGYQSDVRPLIEKSFCFVLPSYHEGMANTLLECGAMGRPLITSSIHGCMEAVVDGENGYLVAVKNIEDLYQKIKKFIELPYEDKANMGRASRKHIEDMFDKRKIVETTVEELKK